MNRFELGSLIRIALEHALHQQQKLLLRPDADKFLPIIQHLARFQIELEKWHAGKFHLDDRLPHFLKEAQSIEQEADQLSESLWTHAPVSLVPIFHAIADRQRPLKDEDYPHQIRAQYNNFRLALLEQTVGARFLANNTDLGDETERILLQYFERRFGQSVRVLRGGHIFDYANNRSPQIDIIITPANALGYCPADTGDGKYNVMVDQVLAAISVTATLSAATLRERISQLQKIPRLDASAQDFARSESTKWPLCYIIGADSDVVESLTQAWREFGSLDDLPLEMILMLDSGYIRQRSFVDASDPGNPIKHEQLREGCGIRAGLGLALLEAQIAKRNCVWTNQASGWVDRRIKQITDLEFRDPDPTWDSKREGLIRRGPIRGVLSWGFVGMTVHNRLPLNSLCTKIPPLPNNVLLDRNKPRPRGGWLNLFDFEPRWFKAGVSSINGDYCTLEEWIDSTEQQKARRQIVVFDIHSGAEVTDRLPRPLNECADIQELDTTTFVHL